MTACDDILDTILVQIGGIGKHQIKVLSCLGLVILFHSAAHIAYVFTSMDSDYRCLIPGCEEKISADPDWLRHAVPFKAPAYDEPLKCQMFKRLDNSSLFRTNCSSSEFDSSAVINCNSHFFYDDKFYIEREFNLLCDDSWKLSLVGSTNTLGMFLGLLVTGFISDRYGRKRLLLIGMSGCGVIGLIKTLSPSFYWFLTFELLEAIFSAGTCGCVFIIAVELVVPESRALMGAIMNTFYTFGEVIVAVVAWSCLSWKSLIYCVYVPCVMLILLYLILPESLRWMLSKGRIDESKQVLRHIAKVNQKHLSEDILDKLTVENIETTHQSSDKIMGIFKSKCLFRRFLNCCFCWITCAFLFYGLILNSVSLYGNKYMDFILISLTELPAYWSSTFFVNKIGRRASISGSFFITMLSCVCFLLITKSSSWFYLFVYCMGKFGATAAFNIIYIITSEIFPTSLRHTIMGLCSTVGRLGSMGCPQTYLLGQIWEPIPLLMFATASLIAGILSLFFPETKDLKLPDTIEEAEEIK